MSLEKGKISGLQLCVLVIGFVFGSTVLLLPGQGAGHDAWIAVLIGMAEGLVIAWIYTVLARRFKTRTIIEINEMVFGPIIGKFISLLFIWYILHLGALVLSNFAHFFHLEMYPATPVTITMLLMMLVCASAVSRGVEVIARCSLILVPITIIVLVFDSLLLIPHIDLHNLMPIMDVPIKQLLLASHGAASFPFAETVAFLMILAFLNHPEEGPDMIARGLVIPGLLIVFVVARNDAVLGPMADYFNYTSYHAIQMIEMADVLTRLEVLVAINLMTMGFIKICVLFYGTALGLGQVFNLNSYRPLVLPVGVLMVILAVTNVENVTEMFEFNRIYYSIYAVPFQVGIPLITLAVAKMRKLPGTEEDQG